MKPLSGITVIEAISRSCPSAVHIAAAMCTRIASDLGVRVLKFNQGASLRMIPPFSGDTSALHMFLDGSKDNAASMPVADIMITDDEVLARTCSKRVIFSLLPPDLEHSRPATEFTLMAMGGLLDLIGDDKRQPLRIGGHQLAYAAGLAGYIGLVAALDNEHETTVDVNLLDVAVWLNWKTPVTVAIGESAPSRAGDRSDWQVVRCADGWMAVVYMPRDWPALKRLANDAELDDPRFDTMAGRRENGPELMDRLAKAFASRTRAEIYAEALRAKVPLGPVWSLDELLVDAHNQTRGLFTPVETTGTKSYVPRLPVLWNGKAFYPSESHCI